MTLTDIYSQKILEIAGQLAPECRLDNPDASAQKSSRVCGSRVAVDLSLTSGLISAYGHDVQACAMGQTSASIVAQHILGSTPDEMRVLRAQMMAMLKEQGVPPDEKWADLKFLQPVRDFPARHASTMLVFEAIIDCLDQIDQKTAT